MWSPGFRPRNSISAGPHALRSARQVLGAVDPHLIQTAAHDAVLDIVRYRATFRGDSRASTWIFTVTRRAALRCVRREERRPLDAISLSVEGVAWEADLTASEWFEPATAAGAWAELQAFVPNARWREVWLLHNDPELCLSIDAIAERLQYTRGSVAVILSRVRARIRDVA